MELSKTKQRTYLNLLNRLKNFKRRGSPLVKNNFNLIDLFNFLKSKSKLGEFLEYSEPFFRDCVEANKISIEELKELHKLCFFQEELLHLCRSNYTAFSLLLSKGIINFSKLSDTLKQNDWLWILLRNDQVLEELTKHKVISVQHVLELYTAALTNNSKESILAGRHDFQIVCQSKTIVKVLLKSSAKSFQDVVSDASQIQDGLLDLLKNKELFRALINDKLLSSSDLRSLLDNIMSSSEVEQFVLNYILFKKCVDSNVLRSFDFKRFNELIVKSFRMSYNIQKVLQPLPSSILQQYPEKVFDDIEYLYTHSEISRLSYDSSALKYSSSMTEEFKKYRKQILELNRMLRQTYLLDNLTLSEKKEIFDYVEKSEKASSTLRQIVDSNLHSQYDFKHLRVLLIKDDQKKKLKLNF